jgi:hypothetical protein
LRPEHEVDTPKDDGFRQFHQKRAPRAGESCIFKTSTPRRRERHFAKQRDLQIDPRKQNVHHAEARAQLSEKMRTAR